MLVIIIIKLIILLLRYAFKIFACIHIFVCIYAHVHECTCIYTCAKLTTQIKINGVRKVDVNKSEKHGNRQEGGRKVSD